MWLLKRIGERLLGSVDRLQRAFHRSPPAFRRGAAMLVDALIVIESFAVTLLFRFAGNVDPAFWRTFWPFAGFAALLISRGDALSFVGIALALACCALLAALPKLMAGSSHRS